MERIRFGVIGVGGMGSGHCDHMHEVKEAQLTAVCDTNPETLGQIQAKHGVPGFANHEELFDSGLVDAVIVATPHYFHPPIAITAFSRGLHVMSEKPIAVTVSAADSMIRAARQSGCAFGVMYQMRSLGQTRVALKLIQDGRLGEIYRTSLVMGWYRSQAYYNSGGWRATWAGEGGGVLINQAPHLIDLYTLFGGMPFRLTGQTRTRLHDIEVEDEAFATLEYANGAHGYLYASTNESPTHELLEICGDKGKLVIHGSTLKFFEVKSAIRQYTSDSSEMWGGPETEEVPLEIPKTGGHHMDITGNFCRHILHGEPLISPGIEGLNAVEMINGIIMSGHTGQPVSLPLDRAAYDELITKLQQSSKAKLNVVERRETDPHYVTK